MKLPHAAQADPKTKTCPTGIYTDRDTETDRCDSGLASEIGRRCGARNNGTVWRRGGPGRVAREERSTRGTAVFSHYTPGSSNEIRAHLATTGMKRKKTPRCRKSRGLRLAQENSVVNTTKTDSRSTVRMQNVEWMQLSPANTPTAPAPTTSPMEGCSTRSPPLARIVDGGCPYGPPPRNESALCVRCCKCTEPGSNAAGASATCGKARVAGI